MSMEKIGKAAFFFGSGISRSSGAPMVADLTARLLGGSWVLHTDDRFYPGEIQGVSQSHGPAKVVQDFLNLIKANIDRYLLPLEGRLSHYEDLYSACQQLLQNETLDLPNFMVTPFGNQIKADSAYLWKNYNPHIDDNSFASLLEKSCDLIQWSVYHGLASAKKPCGLQVLSEIAKSASLLNIFTLNHDLLVERQLTETGINFQDGFGERSSDCRIYNADFTLESGVNLFKLHGSVNWYLCRFKDFIQFASVDSNIDRAIDGSGMYLFPLEYKPAFLTGTIVKEQEYGVSLFGELFTHFRTVLSRYRTLICCGYGWGDKGINRRLNQWLLDHKENRVVLLHKGPLEGICENRFWGFKWERYSEAGKIVVVPKWLSECNITDLKPFLN